MNKKILVAVSGGVDSSVAVLLLREAGWEVGGVVMKMSPLHEGAVSSARAMAEYLGIPLTVLDLQAEFSRLIVDNFVNEYVAGRTPNPCVRCNPLIKFARLAQTADEQDCGAVATGHYARVQTEGDFLIRRAVSAARDQSYMLCRLPQEIRRRLIFPLGELEKTRVREIAANAGLPNFSAPDSQENCFVPDQDYTAFIKARCGVRKGDIISPDGIKSGEHNGLYHYTIGQRKGLGAFGRPVFVKKLDAAANTVILGWGGEEFSPQAAADSCIWHTALPAEFHCEVKIRSAAKPAGVTVCTDGERAQLTFDAPQRAVTPGQSAVFYDGDAVIGCGIFF